MDQLAMQTANLLCGNDKDEAVIEMTLHGVEIIVESEVLLAVCGGGSELYADGRIVPFYQGFLAKPCTLLQFRPYPAGCRAYLAIAGGFKVTPELQSCSTYVPARLGGLHGRPLQQGDRLLFKQQISSVSSGIRHLILESGREHGVAKWGAATQSYLAEQPSILRIMKGPEWERFDRRGRDSLMRTAFQLSNQSDRMGYRFEGKGLRTPGNQEMQSTAVVPGTIQVTPDSTLLLLMSDAQTTGGYPRIAQVASADLPRCAQLRPGHYTRFKLILPEQAEELYLENERRLKLLEYAIALRFG
jgi:antagonist of KipI